MPISGKQMSAVQLCLYIALISCRDVFELREALKIKGGESETYISEIEVQIYA